MAFVFLVVVLIFTLNLAMTAIIQRKREIGTGFALGLSAAKTIFIMCGEIAFIAVFLPARLHSRNRYCSYFQQIWYRNNIFPGKKTVFKSADRSIYEIISYASADKYTGSIDSLLKLRKQEPVELLKRFKVLVLKLALKMFSHGKRI